MSKKPIGVFDSGYGGLTILKEIVAELPRHDFIYLGDNARAPYGPRSYETVYHYTLECVNHLFLMGCELVILACNTASAKALRTIQQVDLPKIGSQKRVLGVIRPTTEIIGKLSKTGRVGIMGTSGTVNSKSYETEIAKFFPEVRVTMQACPMLVPLIESGEHESEGADYFIRKYTLELLKQEPSIDTILLACTHYPLIADRIRKHLPAGIELISQGKLVAESLALYLSRHPEIENQCSKNSVLRFFTTDQPETFDKAAEIFFGRKIRSEHLAL